MTSFGIRSMIQSKSPETPSSVISRPETRKAPTASGKVKSARAVARKALPAIEEAPQMGSR
jgi:hypothetical protein